MNKDLFPENFIDQTTDSWLPQIKVKTQVIYTLSLCFLSLSIIALPFIYIDVTVSSNGIIRPLGEKSEIKMLSSGIIENIFVNEGNKVKKGDLLLTLKSDVEKSKLSQYNFEQSKYSQYLHDLQILRNINSSNQTPIDRLQSPIYKQEYIQFNTLISEKKYSAEKAQNLYSINKNLYEQTVISWKDYKDTESDFKKLHSEYQNAQEQQIAKWQGEYNSYNLEYNRIKEEKKQLNSSMIWNEVKAPVTGNLQLFTGKYTGGQVQAGETIGIISPDSTIISECYLSPKDIGFIKNKMPVIFQIDAFNYNEWGIIKGTVKSIDNDFVIIDNKPVFRVKCTLEKNEVKLKNGYKGLLKKGMTLHARFIVAKRSIYQMLYSRADSWFNPNSKSI